MRLLPCRSELATFAIGCSMLLCTATSANNITTTTGSLVNNTGTTVQVQFNVTWANSWRIDPDRWDAAWLFVKYRASDGVWRHCSLNNTGHTAPTGSTITAGLTDPASAFDASTNPAVGAFIYRSADGSGTFVANGVQLLWNYSVNGVSLIDVAEIRVFAIEMVNVPQSAFAAGSGGSGNNEFTLTTINTAAATTAPTGSGSLGGQAGGFPTGQTAPTSAGWPNGFNAFYCMKYELSQQGYVDLLNTLTYTQQAARTQNGPSSPAGTGAMVTGNSNRNGIDIQTPGVASTTPAIYACNFDGDAIFGEAAQDGTDIACNFLGWNDLLVYLDWSGLRPMTELEFEKACRGTQPAVANEYPWGTTAVAVSAYTLSAPGATNEGIATNYSTTSGNAMYAGTGGTIAGPIRVGIFAANGSNTGRVTSGATYYGVMQMSDDLQEQEITIGTVQGRAFTGTHGNGLLTSGGDADASGWPAPAGSGFRGGAWDTAATSSRTSDRNLAFFNTGSRINDFGGRGVRTAP